MKDFTKSVLKTAAAAVAMAGIAAYAYLGEFKKGQEEAARKEEAKKLFKFDKSRVTAVDVIKDGKTISIQKDGSWRIVAPVKTEGDGSTVDALLAALENFTVERVIEEKPADLAVYGLDKPQFKVTARYPDSKAAALSMGVQNQFDQACYVMRDGDPKVYQASSSMKWGVDKDLFALRDKRVFMGDIAGEFMKLEVVLPGGTYTAEKAGDGWTVAVNSGGKVQKDRADDEEITRISNAIRSVRAVGTAADGVTDPGAWGLDPGRGSVAVWRNKEMDYERVVIALSKKNGTRVVHAMRKGSDTVYELGEQFYKDMDKGFFELRYKKPISFRREDVSRIVLKTGSGTAVLVKETDDAGDYEWFFDEPGRPKAKVPPISSMLYELAGMKAVEFKGDSQAVVKQSGLGDPGRIVELFDGSGKELGRLEIGGAAEKGVYVRGSARPEVLVVEKGKVEQVPSDPAVLRDDG